MKSTFEVGWLVVFFSVAFLPIHIIGYRAVLIN